MKTQLGSRKIGKCLLASALVGGVAFAGIPTITTTAFADEPQQGEEQTATTVAIGTIADTMMATMGVTDNAVKELIIYQLNGGTTAITEIGWADWCSCIAPCVNDPEVWGQYITEANQDTIAKAVQKLYTDQGIAAPWETWVAAVEAAAGGSEDPEELDGVDVRLVEKIATYNGGTVTDFGTYVSLKAEFKVTSDQPAVATLTLPKEYKDLGCTLVNDGMLAPEVICTVPVNEDESEATDDEAGKAQTQANDEETTEETTGDTKYMTLPAYISEDGQTLSVDLPVSDGVQTLEGTIEFAAHTDRVKADDGTVLLNYFLEKDSDGMFKYLKDFEVAPGTTDTKEFDKANEGYRNSLAGEKFTITFDSQGGTDVAAKEMDGLTEAIAAKFTVTLPTKAGSTFVGWYLDKEGTKPLDPFQIKAEDITAYAKWQVNNETPVTPASSNTNPGTPVQQKQTMSSTGDEIPAGAVLAGFAAVIAAGVAASRRR